jgi:CDP-paratose 2-epimerase
MAHGEGGGVSGVALVTGSAGLIGSSSCRRLHDELGLHVVGIDNDLRAWFFGEGASTAPVRASLEERLDRYTHLDLDIRDVDGLDRVFATYGTDIEIIVHTAAQPSHDWAARDPATDFGVNATGTLNLLERWRQHAPGASFCFTSTNKVYGDAPNALPLVEHERRWELDPGHPFAEHGIDETFTIDQSRHSLFGASKVAADVLVQEYGNYFGLNSVAFRCGCLTGPDHAGAELHGFLAYLMRCTVEGRPYRVFGYGGKQVRDNIHAEDVVGAFLAYHRDPRPGAVYNLGGGRHANCSMLEAIDLCEEISGRRLDWTYEDDNRIGDHIWWISDVRRFQADHPSWSYTHDLRSILEEIHDACVAAAT